MLEKYVCAWTRRLPGGRARDPLDDVCMWVSCVYDFARFVYLLHCSELYSAALSLCMRFGAPRRLNLTAEIALASPQPPRCYAPRSHMHTGASAHATNQADAYTLGGAGKESTYAIQSSCFVFIRLWSAASECFCGVNLELFVVDFFLVISAYVSQYPHTTSMLFLNAYERGGMDSCYRRGRAVNPDYLIAPEDETVQMTAAEITEYTAGFDNNEEFGDKEYVPEHDEDEKQVEEVEMRIDTSFRFAYEIRQDLLGS